MNQKLIELKEEIDKFTIIVGGFNSPLSVINGTSKQKVHKNIEDLDTISQINLIDIYRTLCREAECKVFAKTHATFLKRGHKTKP